ncbi:MAG: LysE family transporter [Alistipes sp.]|nr:LysE family transporter [Alistipes sp.]
MWSSIIDFVLRGVIVGLASSVTVGPVAVLCIQRTLNKGRRAGFISGLGVACADTLMAIIAFFFYSLLESQIKEYEDIITVVGGMFVLVVGVAIFLKKASPQIHKKQKSNSTSWRDFASMFGFTLANFVSVIPYILAFFAMLGVSSHDGSKDVASLLSSALILGGFFAGAAMWWFIISLIISLFKRGFRPHHMQTINRVAGVIISLLGIITILSTFISNTPNGAVK